MTINATESLVSSPAAPRMNQKIAVAVVFVAVMFMSIMDATIVNVALPTIGRTFHVAATSVDTISIYFLVSLAVFIPASGWLGDRFGGKRILLLAIVVFTIASALCGLAQSLLELVLFRVLQGIAGGMLAPIGMALLYRTYPPEERVRASAILTIPTALAPALGPVIGGVLVTELSWRWIFFVNLPIGCAALLFGLMFLDDPFERQRSSFDVRGFMLAGAGLGALMYGISEGPILGWQKPEVLSTAIVGGLLLAALVRTELRQENPMIDFSLLKNRLFATCDLIMMIGSAAFLGTLFLTALFLQDGRDLSALRSGLTVFPEAVGVLTGSQFASRFLYARVGPRRQIFGALFGLAIVISLMSLVGAHTSLWWTRVLMFSMGLSMGHVFLGTQAAGFAKISPSSTGRASTMFSTVRQVGAAFGVAVITSVVVAVGATTRVVQHITHPNLTGYHAAYLCAAAIGLTGAFVALRIRDDDARSTMVRRTRKKVPVPTL